MAQLDPQQVHVRYMQTHTPAYRFAPGESFALWQQRARARLGDLLAPDAIADAPGDVEIIDTCARDGHRETKFSFRTEPDYSVAAHLLIPDSRRNPPVVICLQGHASGMRSLSTKWRSHFVELTPFPCSLRSRAGKGVGKPYCARLPKPLRMSLVSQ